VECPYTKHLSKGTGGHLCQKANRTIGFLKRNLNIVNSDIKEKAYTALVRPTVEYASSVWDPYL